MITEKPLHVRVAEALGWTYLGPSEVEGGWEGEPPSGHPLDKTPRRLDQHIGVLRYDTDWSATGPLIERFGIGIYRPDEFCPDREFAWVAVWGGVHGWDDGAVCADEQEGAATPLEAVCRLILAMAAAGKLDA